MILKNINFIKSPKPYIKEYTTYDPSPMFRKKFIVKNDFISAKVYVCGLGYGYFYINGKKISEDLFTAPVSDYNKTLWYNSYDVTSILTKGENIAAAILGNGFFNEPFDTPWNHNKASWRDKPKFVFELEITYINEKVIIKSDESWKCSDNSPIIFNQLRNGEYFDSRLYNENWNTLAYDDSAWDFSELDTTPPSGIFRECECEPIREDKEYPALNIIKTDRGSYIFDIGQNISGYIKLKIKQAAGDKITIKYVEQINSDNTLQTNNMENFYPTSIFQTDIFICNGEEFTWSPRFCYHGFRYIELTGLTGEPAYDMVKGVYVHQAVEDISGFDCSNKLLNKLFDIGKKATLCNLFYMPTDCPTREKLGWANDAQASVEQMLTNFNTVKFFKKWMVDIVDSMKEDGAIPGIIPTGGWGYDWGTGPISSGILFELPYKIYLFTGDSSLLVNNLSNFKKHLKYIVGRADTDRLIGYGLCDWAGPFSNLEGSPVPVKFTDTIMYIKFLKISL
ncbi:MAG: alpha-rhamnosidase, partial [Clostridia bacterium]|nr:alpha-rhamnosidase [Clostridia bacterium]